MQFYTLNQGYLFFFAVYGGAAIGLLYDVFRLIRVLGKRNKKLTAVLDVVFWLAAVAAVFYILLISNNGRVRLFSFLGFALGCGAYFAGISPVVKYLCNKFAGLVKIKLKKSHKYNKLDNNTRK
ncbi:MAG: spore cortex biosynthesis protein YabQ [Christensenellales bacterium]|jgi:spore cortex biosynthesis protein YabQ